VPVTCMDGLGVVDALLEVATTSRVDAECIAARRSAVQALTPAARRGDERALQVLVSSLQDWPASVRNAALEALAEVATKGDRRVVYARLTAIRALAPLAASGNKRALDAIVAGLKDQHISVREGAMEELAKIASNGDGVNGGELSARLSAVKALAAETPDSAATAAAVLGTCLEDWHAAVQKAAACGLEKFVGKASSDPAASKAIEAFSARAMRGDRSGLTALMTALERDEASTTWRQALGALVRVVLQTDSAQPAEFAVKAAAAKAIGAELLRKPCRASPRDQEGLLATLALAASDWHADVRKPSLTTLCSVAEATKGRGNLGLAAVAALAPKACEGVAEAAACLKKLGICS